MTKKELEAFFDALTWEQFEEMGLDTFFNYFNQYSNRNEALLMFVNWFNKNRPDDGYLKLV